MFVLLPLKMPNDLKLKIVQGRLDIPLKYLLFPFCHPKGVVCIHAKFQYVENSQELQAVDKKDCVLSRTACTQFCSVWYIC